MHDYGNPDPFSAPQRGRPAGEYRDRYILTCTSFQRAVIMALGPDFLRRAVNERAHALGWTAKLTPDGRIGIDKHGRGADGLTDAEREAQYLASLTPSPASRPLAPAQPAPPAPSTPARSPEFLRALADWESETDAGS